MITRSHCADLDTADPLASLADRFALPDGVIYLDGNSLGPPPVGVARRVLDVVEDQWGKNLVRGWNLDAWIDLPVITGDKIARLIGAEPGSVLVTDSTSVNLFKVVAAALSLRPDRSVILSDLGNFPTDVYVMSSAATELRLVEPDGVLDAIDPDVAVVALTEVDYRGGRRHDVRAITAAAHEAGGMAVWDLAHSAGVLPIDIGVAGADFAVGCGYKYLNGGPGAPAFVYVAPRHLDVFDNPIKGWFAHAAPFDLSLDFVAAPGIERAAIGTPQILGLAALDESLGVFAGVDMEMVGEKSARLTGLFIDLADQRLPRAGFELLTPRDPTTRGSHVALRHEGAYGIVQALIDRGVIGDFRAPDVARFGFGPLYLRYVDVWDAVEALVEVVGTGAWRDARFATRVRVT